jgi:hypothetical protein
MKQQEEIKISKITEAERRWGMDVLAKVFADINNKGKRKTHEAYLENEMYLHLACMQSCFPLKK